MTAALSHFFYMGGYGLYVWGAYGSVIFFLFIQWFLPWQRLQNYLSKQKKISTQKNTEPSS